MVLADLSAAEAQSLLAKTTAISARRSATPERRQTGNGNGKITKEMIARILAHVGGAANVAQAGNCMTRLRLTLRDESLADSAAIRQIDGVMG